MRATTNATLLELPDAVFRNQILTLPGVAGNLLLALTERMRKANTAALKTQREQLELQHLRRELQVARQLQIDMVPQLNHALFPVRDDIDACGFMEPGPKVGGSLFDCYFADRQHLFFCIGDVSGHGMAAALFMSRVVSVLRNLVPEYVMEPAGLLSDVNSRLCEGNDASIFVALLGAIPNMSYLNCDITLAQDDLLLCHTEGLTNAANAVGEEFGERRLLDQLTRHWHLTLPELMAGIRAAAGSFVGAEQLDDDCTLLALRRSPLPAPRAALAPLPQ